MSRSTGSRRTCWNPPPSPWTANSHQSTAAMLASTATTTGPRNSGVSSAPAAFAARSDSSVPRARRASSGLAFGAAAGASPVGDDAQGQQLGGDEVADLVGGQGPAQVGADQLGDGGRVAGAVDPAGHLVQQRPTSG